MLPTLSLQWFWVGVAWFGGMARGNEADSFQAVAQHVSGFTGRPTGHVPGKQKSYRRVLHDRYAQGIPIVAAA